MKLSQRLTRAGLTFILLGSVAAVMPDNDVAQATTVNCNGGTTTRYRLTSSSSADPASGTIYRAPTGTQNGSLTLYTFVSTDNGVNYNQVGEPLNTSGAGSAVSFTEVGATPTTLTTATTGAVVYPNSTNTTGKSGLVTASFTGDDGITYKPQFTVNVN